MLPVLSVEVSADTGVPTTTIRHQDDPSPHRRPNGELQQVYQFYAGVDLHAISMRTNQYNTTCRPPPDFVADVPMRERLTLSTQFDDTKRSLVMHKSRFR